MKKLLVVILLAATSAGAVPRSRVENAKAFTVLVTNEGFLGGGRGSGILMDSTHVLTCAHMIRAADDVLFIYTYPLGRVVKGHPQFVDVTDDIMLLVLDSAVPVAAEPVFQPNVEDGEPVTVIGNALGCMNWIITTGVIAGTEREYLLSDAHVNPGDSGGPWLNAKGEIVAMTDWGIGPNTAQQPFIGIEGGISAKKIIRVLANYKKDKLIMEMFTPNLRARAAAGK